MLLLTSLCGALCAGSLCFAHVRLGARSGLWKLLLAASVLGACAAYLLGQLGGEFTYVQFAKETDENLTANAGLLLGGSIRFWWVPFAVLFFGEGPRFGWKLAVRTFFVCGVIAYLAVRLSPAVSLASWPSIVGWVSLGSVSVTSTGLWLQVLKRQPSPEPG